MGQERVPSPNDSPRSSRRGVTCCLTAIGIPFVLLLVGILIVSLHRPSPLLVIAMQAHFPDGDTIAYGWTSNYVYSPLKIGYAEYYSFIDWRHDGRTRRYVVLRDDCPLRPRDGALELRATPDSKRVWLVDTDGRTIHASLDRTTGAFLGPFASRLDPSLPLEKQQASAGPGGAYPTWAIPTGGKVLARLTKKDCDMLMLKSLRR